MLLLLEVIGTIRSLTEIGKTVDVCGIDDRFYRACVVVKGNRPSAEMIRTSKRVGMPMKAGCVGVENYTAAIKRADTPQALGNVPIS